MIREINVHSGGLDISHKSGPEYRPGDTDLSVSSDTESFTLEMSCYRGRGRDNYDYSDEVDIELNEEEAHELMLALMVWLESRA